MNNKVIAALEKEIAATEEQITKIDISQVDYIKEMNKKLESLKDQLNYYQAYYIKIKSEMMRFNQELYKEAGLTKEVYITDASEVAWASTLLTSNNAKLKKNLINYNSRVVIDLLNKIGCEYVVSNSSRTWS